MDELTVAMNELHPVVNTLVQNQRESIGHARVNVELPNFLDGDFVLVAGVGFHEFEKFCL